jgi:UDP-N-acetylglucosamine--N-acetylmuramyl-(pentapeptide) pyrophosphoryl-undecaprenol N-acetylglucosamine transferase
MKVLIAGGGTAGHVFPALALATQLTEGHGAVVRFAGTPSGQEATLVPAAGFPFVPVEAQPLVRAISLRAVAAPVTAVRSVSLCRPLAGWADVVVGMGGYVAVPVVLAAARSRRPVVLHEQNAVPGLANRALSRLARTVAISFPETERLLPRRAHTVLTGTPVRDRVLAVRADRPALEAEARAAFELEPGRTTVVIFGGSLGALHLDRAAVDASRILRDRDDLQILLLTGPAHIDEVRSRLGEGDALGVRALAFLDRMELAYAVADLIVSRAGATTVAEITACGLPSILIPYPYATGRHQEANARALQRGGAAAVVMDDALTGPLLASRIATLVGDGSRLSTMAERAAALGRADAAEALAKTVVAAAER